MKSKLSDEVISSSCNTAVHNIENLITRWALKSCNQRRWTNYDWWLWAGWKNRYICMHPPVHQRNPAAGPYEVENFAIKQRTGKHSKSESQTVTHNPNSDVEVTANGIGIGPPSKSKAFPNSESSLCSLEECRRTQSEKLIWCPLTLWESWQQWVHGIKTPTVVMKAMELFICTIQARVCYCGCWSMG